MRGAYRHRRHPTPATRLACLAAVRRFTDTLAKGESVAIAGFETFTTRSRVAPQGCDPQTSEPISIAASTVPAFKAEKALRDSVGD